uniref:Venom protein n=1 Tax=Hadrurus spadix TaxID=141984 RepID=A0A1W7R979_9SCOR
MKLTTFTSSLLFFILLCSNQNMNGAWAKPMEQDSFKIKRSSPAQERYCYDQCFENNIPFNKCRDLCSSF